MFAHVERVVLSRDGRALDQDDPEESASTTPAADAPERLRATDALVAFATAEVGDDGTPAVRAAAVDAVRDAADRLRVDDVVLVPTSTLSDCAASPAVAAAVLSGFDEAFAADEGDAFAVHVAGFGWRYGVDVATKSHPFAVDALTLDPATAAATSDAGAGDDAGGVAYRVVHPDGSRVRPTAFVDEAASTPGQTRVLRAVVDDLADPAPAVSERSGERPPTRGDRARALGVADRDPLDPAARVRPVGAFVEDALRERVRRDARDGSGGRVMPLGGPRALDLADDGVRAYAASLGGRGHGVPLADGRVIVDDLGAATALATVADADRPAEAFPVAFVDQDAPAALEARDVDVPGDAASLRGGATAPTVHEAFASDAAGRDAVVRRTSDALAVADDCGLDALAVATVAPAFAAAREAWTAALASALDAPVLVAVDPGVPAAWPVRVDVIAPTAAGGVIPTGSVRLDPDGVAHFDGEASDRSDVPTVVHAAPAGAVSATIAAICDAPVVAAAGADDAVDPDAVDPAPLPDWLAPTHVRIVPVAADHVSRADDVADAFATAGVRVDVDDRPLTVGARIAAAERTRVPRYVVVGDDERDTTAVPVTDVETGRTRRRDPERVAQTIRDERADGAHCDATGRPGPLHRRLSRRPRFDGA